MDIFDFMNHSESLTLLADKLRPDNLNDFVGQKHILSKNNLLYSAIMSDNVPSSIFYGPPGSGKTSLANIIAKNTEHNFVKLNAVSAGVQEAREIIQKAKDDLRMYGKRTLLFLDECHRWNKAQSDSVLEAIEKGIIIFLGATTENPYVNMTRALVSRCKIFEFKPLDKEDILFALKRALKDNNTLASYKIIIDEDVLNFLTTQASGDLRSAYNALETIVFNSQLNENGEIIIDKNKISDSMQRHGLSVNSDIYYDMISAFCKSLRGSNSNAALYWAERLIASGCDPLLICRRLIVHASEDVGLADPQALTIAVSALTAFQNIGLPEGKIPLYNAIIYICEAPKSNSVVLAKEAVENLVKNKKDDNVPSHLRERSYAVSKNEYDNYLYPHDFGGYVKQEYLPKSLQNELIYIPKRQGFENEIYQRQKEREK